MKTTWTSRSMLIVRSFLSLGQDLDGCMFVSDKHQWPTTTYGPSRYLGKQGHHRHPSIAGGRGILAVELHMGIFFSVTRVLIVSLLLSFVAAICPPDLPTEYRRLQGVLPRRPYQGWLDVDGGAQEVVWDSVSQAMHAAAQEESLCCCCCSRAK